MCGGKWELAKARPGSFPHEYISSDHQIPDALICAVCTCVMHDPVSLAGCGHIFDRECVHFNGQQIKCPKCRCPPEGFTPLPSMRQYIRELIRVSCPDCGDSMTVDEFNHHLWEVCPHTTFQCMKSDLLGTCGQIVSKEERHLHETQVYPCIPRQCPSCGEKGIHRGHPDHTDGVCVNTKAMLSPDASIDVILSGLRSMVNNMVVQGRQGLEAILVAIKTYGHDKSVVEHALEALPMYCTVMEYDETYSANEYMTPEDFVSYLESKGIYEIIKGIMERFKGVYTPQACACTSIETLMHIKNGCHRQEEEEEDDDDDDSASTASSSSSSWNDGFTTDEEMVEIVDGINEEVELASGAPRLPTAVPELTRQHTVIGIAQLTGQGDGQYQGMHIDCHYLHHSLLPSTHLITYLGL